jgi:enoyl-CoA hydratase/carnithine racemase
MTAVTVETTGRVCRLTLNRPDKLNALNEDVRRGLHDALTELADQPDVSVVLIAGSGRAFSAGADLAGQPPVDDAATWAARRHAMGAWQRLLDLLERVPQVTVASLHGHCIGGAVLLAAACDLRIADASLRVRIPELAIGLPLTWAGIPRLARELGLPIARDLVMTGRTLSGDEALQCGFVQRLVPAGNAELAPATDALVDELLAMPPGPLALTRAMFAALGREQLGAAAWADADVLAWSSSEDEYRAAATSYVRRNLSRG